MVSSQPVSGRPRFFVTAALITAFTAAATFAAFRVVTVPGPSTLGSTAASPLTLAAGARFDQTFFVPACSPRAIEFEIVPPPAGTEVAVSIHPADVAPDNASEHVLSVGPGDERLRVPIPSSNDTWRRLFVARGRVVGQGPLTLDTRVPAFGWRGALRVDGAWIGRRALAFRVTGSEDRIVDRWICAFDEASSSDAALGAGYAWLFLVFVALVGALVMGPARRLPSRFALLLPTAVAATAGLVWLWVVPPFEGPDEMAHLQYARFVALERSLPDRVPAADSQWRDHYYEWVQPPLAYLVFGSVLLAGDTAATTPWPRPNPASMLAGGSERTLFRHSQPDRQTPGLAALGQLRGLGLFFATITVLVAAITLRWHLEDTRLAIAAATCLPLIPQWSAVLTAVSNDALATLTATAATALLLHVAVNPEARWHQAWAGVLIGLALATKLTTAFLLPMAMVALLTAGVTRRLWRRTAMLAGGLLVATGWVYARNWLVFGDPMASQFKRALLEQSGFLALSQAQPRFPDRAFWVNLHGQVFESFWARFGSLGAGPTPGSRLWWFYGVLSCGIAALLGLALWQAGRKALRHCHEPGTRALVTAAAGCVSGLSLWIGANLVGRDDVVVHWTPRHLLPLTLPALWLVATGLQGARRSLRGGQWAWRASAGLLLAMLALGWFVSLRHVVAQFHFGAL